MDLNRWLWPMYARTYDMLLYSPLYRDLIDEVTESLTLESADSLLNAGCGTGNLEKEVVSRNFKSLKQINAVDFSVEMLAVAKEKVNSVRFEQADLNQTLSFPDNSFDRIAMVNVLYALPNPEYTLGEISRVLRPGGRLVVVNSCKGASLVKLVRASLKRVAPGKKISFCFRMFLLFSLNIVIAAAGRSGYYHFWGKQDWENILPKKDFLSQSIHLTYGQQAYLVVAEKGGRHDSLRMDGNPAGS